MLILVRKNLQRATIRVTTADCMRQYFFQWTDTTDAGLFRVGTTALMTDE